MKVCALFFLSIVIFELCCRLLLVGDYVIRLVDDRTEWHHFHRIKWIKRKRNDVYYTFDEHHPLYGWTLKKNVKDLSVFDEKFLNSNSIGCRGKQEYSQLPPEGMVRIAVIGDSFSFGEEVSDDETFSYFLQRMIPKSEVMNFSIHGYGHDQMLLRLRNEVIKYRPHIVILGYIDSDDYRNLVTFRDYAKPRFYEKNGELVLDNVPVPTPEELIKREPFKLKSVDILITFFRLFIDRSRYAREKKYRALIIEEMIKEVEAIGARFVIVHLPYTYNRFDAEAPASETSLKEFISEKANVPFTAARDVFREFKAKGYRYNDSGYFHWGKESHYTVAVSLARLLVQHHLLPNDSSAVNYLSFPAK